MANDSNLFRGGSRNIRNRPGLSSKDLTQEFRWLWYMGVHDRDRLAEALGYRSVERLREALRRAGRRDLAQRLDVEPETPPWVTRFIRGNQADYQHRAERKDNAAEQHSA